MCKSILFCPSLNLLAVAFLLLCLLLPLCSAQHQGDLTLGETKLSELSPDQPHFFTIPQLESPLSNDVRLIVCLTSFCGDADLYLSVSNRFPGPESGYDLSSYSRVGQDFIEVNSTMSGALPTGPYYIGVHASQHKASYSIVASKTDMHITVTDGVPQAAHVGRNQYTYFKYVSSGNSFTVTATAIYGNPDFYISSLVPFPSRTNYTMKKSGVGSDYLDVYPSEPTTYFIAVYGFGSNSYFNLEVKEANTTGLLTIGIPSFETIQASSTKYFKFKLTYETDLKIKVKKKTYSGDPSLFVSTVHQKPSVDNSEWRGQTQFRDEELSITKNDITYTSYGYYYIAVYDASIFNVDVFMSVELSDISDMITRGNPATGVAPAGKSVYYKVYYDMKPGEHAQYLEITATPRNSGGKLQLYASNTKEFPDSTAQFHGSDVLNSNVIRIDDPAIGWLYITLLANNYSSYSLTASQEKQYIDLDAGVPAFYNIRGGLYRDFRFRVDPKNDVVISMHSYSGDADLYVGTTTNVSRQNYIWTSAAGSSDVLTISKNDPGRQSPEFSGQLYIAVYGFRDSSFNITAFTVSSIVDIYNGVSLTGSLKRGKYARFKYYLTCTASLYMNLRGLSEQSNPDLYVSMENVYPDKHNSRWTSTNFGDDFLHIPYASQGWYYIGVDGFRDNTTFTLNVSAGAATLSSYGYSLIDYVHKGHYRYYNSSLLPKGVNPVVTGVTLIAGHTELYANTNGISPSRSQSTYKDTSWPGNFISVKAVETENLWSFAVFGVETSYYFIHVSPSDTQGSLKLAEPKIGFVKKGESVRFKYSFYDTASGYSVFLNRVASIPSKVAVYVDQYPNMYPNATSHRWTAEGTDDLLLQLPGAYTAVTVYITVNSFDADVRFQISITDETESITLTEEQPNMVTTKSGQKHFFKVLSISRFPGANNSQLYSVLETCDDIVAPVMYGSIREHTPGKNHSEFESIGDGKFRQKMLSPGETNAYYYIGTQNSNATSSFSIYATTFGDRRPVIHSKLEVSELLNSTTHKRIKIPRASGQEPIRYFMYKRDLIDEDPDSINMETVCAIQNGKAQMIAEIQTDSIDVNNLYYDIQVDNQTIYAINVVAVDSYGLAASYSSITFAPDNNTNSDNDDNDDNDDNNEDNNSHTKVESLVFGKPFRGNVTHLAYTRFKIPSVTIPSNGLLAVYLTPLYGDVDLYVDTKEHVNKTNARWKGEQGGRDIITIRRSELDEMNTTFFVAIYGVSENALFLVMAHTSDVAPELQDGMPQVGTVELLKYNYFKFYLNDNSTFSITLTPIDGETSLVVATDNNRPTKNTAQWYSDRGAIDIITVSNTDSGFRGGAEYFIGVYGWSSSKYEITVTKQLSSTLLTEGVAHSGRANRYKYVYFKFSLSSPRGVLITLTSLLDGVDPDIYVSTTNERPSSSSYQWKRNQPGGVNTMFIAKNHPQWIQGTYYIAVQAQRVDTIFQVVVQFEDSSLLLTDGVSQSLNSVIGGYTTFRFFYGVKNNLTLSVTSNLERAVELYGSKSFSKPTRGKHEYVGKVQGTQQFIAIDQGASIQWYFVSVYGIRKSTFNISLSTTTTNQTSISLNKPYNQFKNLTTYLLLLLVGVWVLIAILLLYFLLLHSQVVKQLKSKTSPQLPVLPTASQGSERYARLSTEN